MYKLLDLYCCAGGASYGYEQAGFEVAGVDKYPQPKYRGNFILADAIEYLNANYQNFDAVHASPPCQEYSMASMQFRIAGKKYVDLIAPTREAILKTGLPYIIENVPGAPLINPIELCGMMFGIPTYRHRLFESNIPLLTPSHPDHVAPNAKDGQTAKRRGIYSVYGAFFRSKNGAGIYRIALAWTIRISAKFAASIHNIFREAND